MKHFLSINNLSREDALFLLAEAGRLKREWREQPGRQREGLAGKTLALLFEKPSLRTRLSFDVGMNHLGGHAVYLSPAEVGLGARETVGDVASVLSRMVDGVVARVFKHEAVEELAHCALVPVINGLSDLEHPCQALADLLTLHERKGLPGRKLAYVGDGNNVCHSLLLLCAKVGVSFSCATPEGHAPRADFIEAARRDIEAQEGASGGAIEATHDPIEAVRDADAVYTDVWTSMGEEAEAAARREAFRPYQLNAELLRHAKPDAIVMHDLPAHRGEEIAEDVIDGPQSVVFEQAENRLHAQKAVLLLLLGQNREHNDSAATPGASVTTAARLSSVPLPQN